MLEKARDDDEDVEVIFMANLRTTCEYDEVDIAQAIKDKAKKAALQTKQQLAHSIQLTWVTKTYAIVRTSARK
ncbi:hypothetical protein V6N13_108915 [Hibiscus sabdariffa]|uniref:Uncharacterized protein n=1 Tax=Hibiscus sabdariffa TaxID=183260 RepID=A0ABR2FNK7_9ROSI